MNHKIIIQSRRNKEKKLAAEKKGKTLIERKVRKDGVNRSVGKGLVEQGNYFITFLSWELFVLRADSGHP